MYKYTVYVYLYNIRIWCDCIIVQEKQSAFKLVFFEIQNEWIRMIFADLVTYVQLKKLLTHTHTPTYVRTSTHTNRHKCAHMRTYTPPPHSHQYRHRHKHARTHTYIFTCIHKCTYIHSQIHTDTHTHQQTHTDTYCTLPTLLEYLSMFPDNGLP